MIRDLAQRLEAAGHVKSSFIKAALTREKVSPTGLPFAPHPVALPHADPEHVLAPALIVATLVKPIVFREMGSPATKLSVEIVVMPAFQEKEQAGAGLASLIDRLKEQSFREALLAATTDAQLLAAFESG